MRIEALVRERRTLLATNAINVYLKTSKYTLMAMIQGCDWFRRLGKFWEAYRVIAPDEYRLRTAKLDRTMSRQYLWTARMLNLLGASGYALEMAEMIKDLKAPEDAVILANIYLSNFETVKAHSIFSKIPTEERSYSSKFAQIGSADALAGVGKMKEALILIRSIPTADDEALLKGILFQAEGEYLARAQKYERALVALEKARPYFQSDDQTVDYAFLLKWIATSYAGLGKKTEATRIFNEAISILKKPKHRPESWLDCYYWMDRFEILSPARKKILFSYPGLNESFLKRLERPAEFQLGSKTAEFWISEPSQEWRHREQIYSQISKEIHLLSLVARAGEEGVSIFRILPILWPGDFAIHLHTHRLNQLKRQLLMKYKIKIHAQEQVLRLSDADLKRVSVEVWNRDARPSVFEASQQISLTAIQKHYGIKRTKSYHLVREWENREWVTLRKIGREVIVKLNVHQLGRP